MLLLAVLWFKMRVVEKNDRDHTRVTNDHDHDLIRVTNDHNCDHIRVTRARRRAKRKKLAVSQS